MPVQRFLQLLFNVIGGGGQNVRGGRIGKGRGNCGGGGGCGGGARVDVGVVSGGGGRRCFLFAVQSSLGLVSGRSVAWFGLPRFGLALALPCFFRVLLPRCPSTTLFIAAVLVAALFPFSMALSFSSFVQFGLPFVFTLHSSDVGKRLGQQHLFVLFFFGVLGQRGGIRRGRVLLFRTVTTTADERFVFVLFRIFLFKRIVVVRIFIVVFVCFFLFGLVPCLFGALEYFLVNGTGQGRGHQAALLVAARIVGAERRTPYLQEIRQQIGV